MTWTETHERYRIIREVVAAAETDKTGTLPWRDEYAELFGNRQGLVNALRSRWQRTCQAQLDSDMTEAELQAAHRKLLRSNAGVLRILERYHTTAAADAAAAASEGLSVA